MITLRASARYGYGGKQFVARIVGRSTKFTFEREFLGRKEGKRGEDTSADIDEPGLYETRDIDSKGRTTDEYFVVVNDSTGNPKLWKSSKEDAMKIAKEMEAQRAFADIVTCRLAVTASPLGAAVKLLAVHTEQLSVAEAGSGPVLVKNEFSSLLGMPDTKVGDMLDRDDVIRFRRAEIARLTEEIAQRRTAGEPEIAGRSEGWEILTEAQSARAKAGATVDAAIEACWAIIQAFPEKEAKKVLAALKAKVSPPKPAAPKTTQEPTPKPEGESDGRSQESPSA